MTYYDAANELLQAGRNFPAAAQYVKTYLSSGALVEDATGIPRSLFARSDLREEWRQGAGLAEYQASLSLASGFDRARKALDQLQ